jgi:hypothetical protein
MPAFLSWMQEKGGGLPAKRRRVTLRVRVILRIHPPYFRGVSSTLNDSRGGMESFPQHFAGAPVAMCRALVLPRQPLVEISWKLKESWQEVERTSKFLENLSSSCQDPSR